MVIGRRNKNVDIKTVDWEYSSNLSLKSISSYVNYETGNIYWMPKKFETNDFVAWGTCSARCNKQWWHCTEWQNNGLPKFIFTNVYIYVDFSFPPNFLSLFLFRAVMFIRCYLSIPHRILSVIVDVNGVFKTKYVVTHIQIVGKMSSKSKQNKVSLTYLYKCKFVYW